jgi:hypothetical protein
MLFLRRVSRPSVDFRTVADELVAALPAEQAVRQWVGQARVKKGASAALWAQIGAQQPALPERELRAAWWQPLVQLGRARRASALA